MTKVINPSTNQLIIGRPNGEFFEIYIHDIFNTSEVKVAESRAWNYNRALWQNVIQKIV